MNSVNSDTRVTVSLLTGGRDPHYALGLLHGLISCGYEVEFIGNDHMQGADIVRNRNVKYYNLRGDQSADAPLLEKIVRVVKYYLRLVKYAYKTDSKLFHILWLNKFTYLDMTLMNVYYKILGKRLIFTAHNINIGERDGNNSILNRLCLKFMYKTVDHIFVHTDKMRQQLAEGFGINTGKITVIPFGINNVMPRSALLPEQARHRLKVNKQEKVLLFFGNIAPYKGLEYLIPALAIIQKKHKAVKLIIAGKIKNCESYWAEIERLIKVQGLDEYIIKKIDYIPDEEVEVYFKAADVSILPYAYIYQSGVIFLSYSFGLPVVVTDVGSMKEDVIEGKTGFICKAKNADDLAEKINQYYDSNLYRELSSNRGKIIDYANGKYSWKSIAATTGAIYKKLC